MAKQYVIDKLIQSLPSGNYTFEDIYNGFNFNKPNPKELYKDKDWNDRKYEDKVYIILKGLRTSMKNRLNTALDRLDRKCLIEHEESFLLELEDGSVVLADKAQRRAIRRLEEEAYVTLRITPFDRQYYNDTFLKEVHKTFKEETGITITKYTKCVCIDNDRPLALTEEEIKEIVYSLRLKIIEPIIAKIIKKSRCFPWSYCMDLLRFMYPEDADNLIEDLKYELKYRGIREGYEYIPQKQNNVTSVTFGKDSNGTSNINDADADVGKVINFKNSNSLN